MTEADRALVVRAVVEKRLRQREASARLRPETGEASGEAVPGGARPPEPTAPSAVRGVGAGGRFAERLVEGQGPRRVLIVFITDGRRRTLRVRPVAGAALLRVGDDRGVHGDAAGSAGEGDAPELDLILCEQATRKLSKNLTFKFERREFQLVGEGKGHRLRGATVTSRRRSHRPSTPARGHFCFALTRSGTIVLDVVVLSSAMKILVTGGAGFIGSHVAAGHLAAGHDVAIADNLSSGNADNVPAGARLHLVDIASPEFDLVVGRERPDVVNHHAAQMSVTVSARDPGLDARINCVGLLNVLQSCVRHGVGRFVMISTGGAIYGDVHQRPTSEEVTPQPLSPYAIHKLTGERYLEFFRREHGLSSITLRYGNVYGPRQDPHGEAGVVAIFIGKLLRGESPTIFAYPDQPMGMSRDYVYVEDAMRANLCAIESDATGAFNIAGGAPVRTGELFHAVQAACGTNLTPATGAARPGDLQENWLDVSRAKRLLGWRPEVSLADGLARTATYFRKRF